MKYSMLLLITLFISAVSFGQEKNEKAVCSKYESGEVKETGLLKNDKLHGKWVKYSKEGTAIIVGNYKNNVKIGTWNFVDEASGVITEVIYFDNTIVGVKKFVYDTPTNVITYN